jgi:hypothetical protein
MKILLVLFLLVLSACGASLSSSDKECRDKGLVVDSEDYKNCLEDLESQQESAYFCENIMDVSTSNKDQFEECVNVLATAMVDEYNIDYKNCQKRGDDFESCMKGKNWNSAYEWFKGQK